MTRGVIVLAAPWPRSGSANLFAAQAAAHARSGARVFLLLAPLGRGFSHGKRQTWEDAVSAMRFAGVETVSYPRVGRRRVRSYLRWLCAGRDDYIAISARYAAAGRLPGELAEFVASAAIDLIHANHVYTLPLARRLGRMVQRAGGRRPRVLLETHDIQSDAVAARRQKNPHSHRPDPYENLLETELALCAQADVLIHLTDADCAFFSSRLPGARHVVILPTLHPETEAQLVGHRGVYRPAEFDFVYVGNQHPANLETVRWLLGEVLPLTAPAVRDRVRIVGSVGTMLSRRDPALHARYENILLGEVPSLLDLYTGAKAVLAPAVAGTGSSIKLIEALCSGKPVLTTRLGLRGLPAGEPIGPDIHVHDSASAFAEAMGRVARDGLRASSPSAGNTALYDRLFSNERYFAALRDVIESKAASWSASLGQVRSRGVPITRRAVLRGRHCVAVSMSGTGGAVGRRTWKEVPMAKFSKHARKVFYVLTGQYRVRRLEERVRGLEDRLTVTVSYYEHKIDQLINSVARTLPRENDATVALRSEARVLQLDRHSEAGEHGS